MKSDGYQTFNFQDRKAFSAKYQYSLSDDTVVHGVQFGDAAEQQHAEPERLDARAKSRSSATTS